MTQRDAYEKRRRGGRRVRALTIGLAAAGALGTGALAADLAAHATTGTTAASSSTSGSSTSSSGGTTTGFGSATAPGSTTGTGSVAASSGGS